MPAHFFRSFGGYVRDIKEWIKEAIKLGQVIGDTSKYHTEFSYTAGYDSPFRFLNRHNEIWFIAKQQ
uniref:Heme-binding protein 1 n=1 Tax=Magallana gigas TaxID=29159 RepID=K1PU94_MAGGI